MRKRLTLPQMSFGNRLFWGIIVWVGVIFIWLLAIDPLFSEEMSHYMVWIGVVIGAALCGSYIAFGPRPTDKAEEEED